MKLYPIMATGIRAYCSDVIVDAQETDTVYFMSICGYQATVKGIIANLLENYGISIELEGGERYLVRSDLGYKVQIRKLPSVRVHAMLYPILTLPKNMEEEQNRFFIFTDRIETRRELFFRHLDEKTVIPLHPSWTGWLWSLFEKQGWLIKLKTLVGDYRGYAVGFHPKQLQDLISEALRNNVPAIVACMTWKGENSHGKCDLA